ncbi:MAG: Bax inhibitor-1/YccA family protein [Gemmatimonadota bacterium]
MANGFGAQQTWNASSSEATRVSAFLQRVYGWMFVGLAITAVVALAIASSPGLMQTLVGNPILYIGLIVVELGLVIYLSARVAEMTPSTAATLFAAYSALNGVTLSVILLRYTGTSVATAFISTAGMFGALAVYGTITKRSLAGVGQFAIMGLIGVIIASVVGFFWHSSMLQFVISIAGVIVFTGLSVYDAQRMRQMALSGDGPGMGSYAIVGALALYLDFINLFLMLLRLFGGRRQ